MKRKNNRLTLILLVALAFLLVMAIVSVLDYSPEIKSCTYGDMIEAFEENEVYGYIKDPNN